MKGDIEIRCEACGHDQRVHIDELRRMRPELFPPLIETGAEMAKIAAAKAFYRDQARVADKALKTPASYSGQGVAMRPGFDASALFVPVPPPFVPVIVESPFKGSTKLSVAEQEDAYTRNRRYLERCLRDCIERGESPYASHKMLTYCLDDRDPEERAKGIAAGLVWRRLAHKRIFYIDYGMSPGMDAALALYEKEHLSYVKRRIGVEP